ncbi:MAG: hypothetical protein F4X66_17700 [Chloroflexi bacterium]|nr:hypothetical protein [Chloroflexota bacterium]
MIEGVTDSEYLIARKTAEEYRSKGYEVLQETPLDFLPGFRADLVVRKGGETKVIEIKRRSSLGADPRIRELARIVDSKPGWSFELILVGEPEKLDSPDEARSFDRDGILRRLSDAERTLESGVPEAAFVLAWSALEAAIRELIAEQGTSNAGITTSAFILDQAVSLGIVSREEYGYLTRIHKYRNAIVHGFGAADFGEELAAELIETVRQMTAISPPGGA